MSDYSGQWTLAQQQTLALTPKFSAVLSMIGSSFIIISFTRTEASSRRVYHRLLLWMSFWDIVGAVTYFLSTWPIPANETDTWGNVGNQATCSAQGFFQQLSFATVFYNGALAFHYLVTIYFEWPEDRLEKSEPYMHVACVLFPFSTALASVALNLINDANLWCWIAKYPQNCESSFLSTDGRTNCIRGDNAEIYQFAFFFIPLWVIGAFIMLTMVIIYSKVLRQEKRLDGIRYVNGGPGTNAALLRSRKKSKAVAIQGMLYVLVFLLTWLFSTISRVYQAATASSLFSLLFLQCFFSPMQGLFNFFVYFRPRYKKFRRDHPEESFCVAAYNFFRPIFCCCGVSNNDYTDRHMTHCTTSESVPKNNTFNFIHRLKKYATKKRTTSGSAPPEIESIDRNIPQTVTEVVSN